MILRRSARIRGVIATDRFLETEEKNLQKRKNIVWNRVCRDAHAQGYFLSLLCAVMECSLGYTSSDTCPICLEKDNDWPWIYTKCGHYVHAHCILEGMVYAFMESDGHMIRFLSCTVCRQPFVEDVSTLSSSFYSYVFTG
jgi:hypothetical protein